MLTAPILYSKNLDTPLGPMLAVASESTLFLLEFMDYQRLEVEMARLRQKACARIEPGETSALLSIQSELKTYFNGTLTSFKTPVSPVGTDFQQRVWQALQQIPYGTTQSYLDLALTLNHPKAYRAVAQANGANALALIIPCHRVINHNGQLGGYAGGLSRKQWLINHEKR